MAKSPEFKIYSPSGEYVAACKYAEDAASLAGNYGHGAEIRFDHAKKCTVWREGYEEFSASESFDRVAILMRQRRYDIQRKALVKIYGEARVQEHGQRIAANGH